MSENERKPKTATCDAGLSAVGVQNMIDYYDREGAASAEGNYTEAITYETPGSIDKRRKRVAKPRVLATSTRSCATAKYSVCEAKVKGPNASAGATAAFSVGGVLNMIDTYDREGAASAEGNYTEAMTYETPGFINKPGKRIPKAGACAAAGVGRARAQFSVFEAEAKGPNASAKASASLAEVEVMAGAEIASASASAGLVKVKVGLAVDTGVQIGLGGVGVKVLGTGFKLGPELSVALLGNEVECSVM